MRAVIKSSICNQCNEVDDVMVAEYGTVILMEDLTVDYYQIYSSGTDSANKQVSNGVYFHKLNTIGYTSVKKMILLK